MTCLRLSTALIAALFVVGPLAAQAPQVAVKDPADLFPPDSLFYLEVVKPAELSRDITSFVKGSVIDDLPAFFVKWREMKGEGFFMESEVVALLSAFAGPEALTEMKRMQGAAFAITSLNKKNEPEY